ncbi:MAG TPA: hypothetical protein VK805_01640 [Candidatus Baltobacteraceae bacterium]|nr:hypothetical protein [Candidatus Baltobacteraceae bacterium]
MKRAILPAFLLCGVAPFAAARQPAPQILGLRLGMSYAQAHSRLTEIAQFKSEDEGQQVWTLTHDQRYQYAIIGFDRDRYVRYVTVLARPDGKPVSYADVGDIANATRSGGPGNLRYTWKLTDKSSRFEYLVIAKGKDQHYLDRFAVKRLGAENEREDRD